MKSQQTKRIITSLFLSTGLTCLVQSSFAQFSNNSFPAIGEAGINTTAPTASFDIISPGSPISNSNVISLKVTNLKYDKFCFIEDMVQVWSGNTFDEKPYYPAFIIDPWGKVGIGIKTPIEKLTIEDGDIAMTNVTDHAVRTITANSDYGIMEIRTKKNAVSPVIQMGAFNNSWRPGQIWYHSTSPQHYPAHMFMDYNHSKGTWVGLMRLVEDNGFPKVTIGDVTDLPGKYDYSLFVQHGILTEKVKVALSSDNVNWSDFVFADDYKLRPLAEVETFVRKNKHLPEIPSASEVYKEGLDLAQMDAKLLQKIEELTLYTIQLQKQVDELKLKLDKK